DRTIPLASHRVRLPIDEELNRDLRSTLVGHGFVTQELYWGMRWEVGGGKRLPHVTRADLGTSVLSDGLDGLGEFNLQTARQNHAVLRLHDISDTALARLAVHAHHCFVRAANVLRIDWQIGHTPFLVVPRQRREALLDGILMRPREGGIDEVTGVGMPGMDRKTLKIVGEAAGVTDAGEVELGDNPKKKKIQGQVDNIDIAGAPPIPKQRPLDAFTPRHDTEFRGGHTAAAIIVGVQR